MDSAKMTLQEKLYILFEKPGENRASFILNTIVYILIILSILNLMFYSVEPIREKYGYILEGIGNIVMPIFILEYIGRLYASGYLHEYKGVKGKIKYMLTPYAIIDLLAILPYILLSSGFNSSFIRSLRLLRIFRLFRVKKYAIFVQLMKQILSNLKEELTVLFLYTLVVIVVLSFIIFDIEHEAQPEVFSNIFQTLWWAVATLTTVGYGDMYPITAAGKFITAVITIIGIGFVAIPGGMFASEFMSAIAKEREKKNHGLLCPKCGSEEIQSFSSPVVEYASQKQDFSVMNVCLKCNFTWLEGRRHNIDL
jgi:voltage-gated potassium channel